VLRALALNLPRLGLLRETYDLVRTARHMELVHPPQGRGVTEFNQLFQAAYQAVTEAAVESAAGPGRVPDQELADLLETLSWPFLKLWVEHSQSVQLSVLETIGTDGEWESMRRFVQTYGGDLFNARFMTLANLRGILHQGVGGYLDYLRENPDPLHPVRLLDDLGRKITRPQAERWLGLILQALVENYEEYKDYNTTTPQSDYGQNLHVLLDFLRLKASYDRHAWQSRPVLLAHEVLMRKGRDGAALLWQEAFAAMSREWADEHLQALARLEQTHGVVLRTVADRVRERFVRPLAVERLCALVEPAVEEARASGPHPSFERLQGELQALAATPVGVGLDVPVWLRQLEQQVQRVALKRTALVALAEDFFSIPRQTVPFDRLRAELKAWAEPLKEE
jgi:hypothetical protein